MIAVIFPITLGQFLKLAGVVYTGGEAKRLIGAGAVRVNDEVETRRGRKLVVGDRVAVGNQVLIVASAGPSDT